MAMPIKKTTTKPKMSKSEAMRELAMQSRGTGKGVGPKAETAAAKRGGSMPVSAAVKKKAAAAAVAKKKDAAMAGRKPAAKKPGALSRYAK